MPSNKSEYSKQYWLKNKEILKQKRKTYHCSSCDKTMLAIHMERHKMSNLHLKKLRKNMVDVSCSTD